jgi:hypothetical protein
MDGFGRFFAGRFAQAKDRAAVFIEPIDTSPHTFPEPQGPFDGPL